VNLLLLNRILQKIIRMFFLGGLLFFSGNAILNWNNNTIELTGQVDSAAIPKFLLSLAKSPRSKVLKISKCFGGQYPYVMRLARLVHFLGLETIAEGEVNSGCHVVFMAGKKRSVSDKVVTSLMVHQPMQSGFLAPLHIRQEYLDEMTRFSDGRFPGQFLPDILRSFGNNSGVLFVSVPKTMSQTAHLCVDSGQLKPPVCTRISSVWFEDIGLTKK
jgi:hypothetical protein